MQIRKEGSKVVHQGYLVEKGSYDRPSWCRTSGWGQPWVEHKGKIKPPYRKCKLCFRGEK